MVMRRALPPLSRLVAGLAVLAGLVLTCLGLATLEWPDAIPWEDGGHVRFAGFLAAMTLSVAVLAHKLRVGPLAGGAAILALLALAAGALWPAVVVVWIAAASAVLGRLILSSAGVEDADWSSCLVAGAGVYGTMIGLLAHLPVNYPGLYGAALAAPLIVAPRSLALLATGVVRVLRAPAPPDRAAFWLDVAITVMGLTFFAVALMPEVGHDALAQHLFVPTHLADRHEWAFDAAAYAWAAMPMLGDWLFSLGYMLAGETAARMVNVLFALILAGLVRDLALWAGSTAVGARWAVLIFLSSPLTFTEASTLFVESPWAAFVLAGVLAILRSGGTDARDRSQLVVAGLALGCALGAKAVTLAVLPVLLVVVLAQYETWLTARAARPVWTGLGLLVTFGSLPYVTAWWLTANPVYPFLNQVFQSPLWRPVNFEDARWGKGVSWDLLYRVTFQTNAFMESTPGAAGFQWLLVSLPTTVVLVLWRHRRGLTLTFVGVLAVVLCFHGTAYLRYVFPACAILVAAMGVALGPPAAVAAGQPRALRAAAALAVALNVVFLSSGPFVYRDFPLSAVFSKRQRDEYLARRLPIRRAIEVVNALNYNRTPVVIVADPLGAGLSSDALYTCWYNRPWLMAYAGARTKRDMAGILARNRVDYVIVDARFQGPKLPLDLLESVTARVAELGPISIRRVRPERRLQE